MSMAIFKRERNPEQPQMNLPEELRPVPPETTVVKPFISCKSSPVVGERAFLYLPNGDLAHTGTVQKLLTDGQGHWFIQTKRSIYINF